MIARLLLNPTELCGKCPSCGKQVHLVQHYRSKNQRAGGTTFVKWLINSVHDTHLQDNSACRKQNSQLNNSKSSHGNIRNSNRSCHNNKIVVNSQTATTILTIRDISNPRVDQQRFRLLLLGWVDCCRRKQTVRRLRYPSY